VINQQNSRPFSLISAFYQAIKRVLDFLFWKKNNYHLPN